MFVMWGCSASRATACISTASRKVGPRRAAPLRYIGASICTKGNGTNSVKPPVSACKSRKASRCRAQDSGCSICPYMIVDVVRRPRPCAVLTTSSHSRRVHLVRADDGAHLVVQDLGGGARQGAEARGLELRQKRPDRYAERRRALRDLQWREGVNVHVRDRRLDGAANAEIGLAGVIRMDAALKAYLGRASLPRLGRAAHDFLEREVIGRAAQRLMRLALGEGAELATIGADVGIVDVAVDDVADDVAARRPAKLVGCGDDAAVVGVARREQPHDLRRIQAGAGLSAFDDVARSPDRPSARGSPASAETTFVPGAQSSSRAKPSASLERRACVAISGADQVAKSRAYEG